MIYATDDLLNQVVAFLIQCEKFGNSVQTFKAKQEGVTSTELKFVDTISRQNTVTYEARYLRSILLSIIHD